MNIVWVTSEANPYVKTGGLADVTGALPREQAKQGHNVSVIMPYYPQIMWKHKEEMTLRHSPLGVPMGWNNEFGSLWESKINENLTFYFIEFNKYFDRPFPYDYYGEEYGDNAARFSFLSRGAMQAILALDLYPDILHLNDWQTSLCAAYLKSPLYRDYDCFKNCASVLTIHNIGYQGVFHKSNFYYTGLPWDFFNYTCLEYYDQVNFLKGGIMTADMVNTVSPTYAKEIQTPGFAFTLDSSLRHVDETGRLRGILNGIDPEIWGPEHDPNLPANYNADDIGPKAECKASLQRELGLPVKADTPLFGVVSRLAYQKGIDVFANAIWEMLQFDDVQFAVLGAGESWLERRLSELAGWFPDKFRVYVGYNYRLAHLVEAGSDFFVMPSRYEPCGLNQMYSMRYGTLPIVRATGGLDDTVTSYDPTIPEQCTGFKFYDLYPTALLNTMRWAMSVYHHQPEHFRKMVRNGMITDFSWRHTAEEYNQLYNDAKTKAAEAVDLFNAPGTTPPYVDGDHELRMEDITPPPTGV